MYSLIFPFLLLCLFSFSTFSQTNALPYRPVAAEYSGKLDRIIMISGNPNSLHIYDPVTHQNQTIPLSQPPISLAVTPNQTHAVVGHEGFITYVDLQKKVIIAIHTIPAKALILTTSNTWAYVVAGFIFPSPSGPTLSINLESGKLIKSSRNPEASSSRFNIFTNSIYGTHGASPQRIWKLNARDGELSELEHSPYHGEYCVNSPIWFSSDQEQIYTSCGTIFQASQNTDRDMYYSSILPDVEKIVAFSESSSTKKIALIESRSPYIGNRVPEDDKIKIFDNTYFNKIGEVSLPQITIQGSSFATHGKWVFFNSSAVSLHAILKIDETALLENDFIVFTIPIEQIPTCGAYFPSTSLTIPAASQKNSIEILAPSNCIHQATTNDPWIQLSSNFGAGNKNLTFTTQTNPNSTARIGNIKVGNSILTIHQNGSLTSENVTLLGYSVIDAEYDKRSDKIILISENPNQLIIHSPLNKHEQFISLIKTPLSVSVHPNGSHAAVGHNGFVSYVNLKTASTEKIFKIGSDAKDVVLAPNGNIYIFPNTDHFDYIYSINTSTGKISTTKMSNSGGNTLRLTNNGKYLYATGSSSSKWDIQNGTPQLIYKFQGFKNFSSCGNMWIAEDDQRFFTACRGAYISSEIPSEDGKLDKYLSNSADIQSLSHSSQRKLIVVTSQQRFPISDVVAGNNTLHFYDDSELKFIGLAPLPKLALSSDSTQGSGKFLFWDSGATGVWTVMQSNENPNLWGVTQISPSSIFESSISTITSSASFLPGKTSPGEIITIFGNNLGPQNGVIFSLDHKTSKVGTSLGGTTVYINHGESPILYSSSNQINVIAPYNATINQDLQIQISYLGISTKIYSQPVAEATPAFFTLNGSGSGQAAALNLDGSVPDSTHPATRGSYISLYFTGGGITSFFEDPGSINSSSLNRYINPVSVTVGGVPATVTFAGAAPGLVTGVGQINIKLADNTPTGDAIPVIVTVGNTSSMASVSIAVQ